MTLEAIPGSVLRGPDVAGDATRFGCMQGRDLLNPPYCVSHLISDILFFVISGVSSAVFTSSISRH